MRPRPRVADALFRAGLFVLPFAVAFVYVVSMLPLMPIEQWRTIVGGMGLYLLAPVGTEVVVPVVVILLQEAGAATHVVVLGVASIALVDVFTALFFLGNWDLVERTPYVGRGLRRVEDKCRAVIARKKWGEGATLTALALYVALPVQMTGGLFGSVLGRVLGMDKVKVFLAVTAGSLAGAVPMGIVAWLAGRPILAVLQSATAQTIAALAGILITVAFIAAIAWMYRRGRRNAA